MLTEVYDWISFCMFDPYVHMINMNRKCLLKERGQKENIKVSYEWKSYYDMEETLKAI